jgi:hypothetical protein
MRANLRTVRSQVGRGRREITCQLNQGSLPQREALGDLPARTEPTYSAQAAQAAQGQEKVVALHKAKVECIAKCMA